ncbi:LOL1 [Zea mays]|uniref:LOL1 n=2 Tax=Zea mays TaxID=4577 RepID=A0A1D6PVV3_MAIZE|nr:LOL1 [Zea mays]
MRGEAAGLCRLNAAGICEASPSCVRRRIRQPARQCRFRLLRTQLLRRHSRRPMLPRESSAGTEMAQLVCGGCHTLLMYIRGATSVQCSCCHTVNLAMEANQVAHVNCGNCRMLLMYQYGARSVKCAVCSFVTSVGVSTQSILFQKRMQLTNNVFCCRRLPLFRCYSYCKTTCVSHEKQRTNRQVSLYSDLTWCRAEAQQLS